MVFPAVVDAAREYCMVVEIGVKLGTSSSKISRQRVNFRDTLADSHLARASFVVSKDKDR
jgi:hypothetical protein